MGRLRITAAALFAKPKWKERRGGMYIQYCSASFDVAQNVSHVQSDRFLIHAHPYYEIHYFVRGDVEMIYDGQIYSLQPNGMTLISRNVPHGIRVATDRDYERYTIHFTEDVIRPELRALAEEVFNGQRERTPHNYLRMQATSEVLKLIKNLVKLHSVGEEQREVMVPALLNALLVCIWMTLNQRPAEVLPDNDKVLTSEEVINYLTNHLTEPLNLTDLARAFYCSKGYLNNLFKREVGYTVMSFLQMKRLEYAKLLIENNYPVTKACVMAGFHEYSSFFRAYVKHFGVSPSNAVVNREPVLEPDSIELPIRDDLSKVDRKWIWELYSNDHPEEDPNILVDK